MNNSACPVCQKSDQGQGTGLFQISQSPEETYTIKKCGHCGVIYTYYDHEINLEEYYDQKDYKVQDTRDSIFFKIQKFEYSAVLKKLKSLCVLNSPKILDFGSGKGLFLHFADLKGCQVKGVESSKPRAEYAIKYFGLDINTDYYSSGNIFDTRFDAMTLFHVLEHLQNPSELLKNLIHHNLKEGGLLIAEVPNFGSWQSTWAGSTWLHLDVPRHLSHFTDDSLTKLVEESGCRIIMKHYFSIHLGIVGMVQSIFSWFGYRGFLIAELKLKKSQFLLLKVVLVLPFAILLEGLAILFKKGGILRYYAFYEPGRI